MKDKHGRECKICERPFTTFRWQPGKGARYKNTELCQTCAKVKNVCQTCMFDLEYGLPVQVRDHELQIADNIPKQGANRDFFLQNVERFANFLLLDTLNILFSELLVKGMELNRSPKLPITWIKLLMIVFVEWLAPSRTINETLLTFVLSSSKENAREEKSVHIVTRSQQIQMIHCLVRTFGTVTMDRTIQSLRKFSIVLLLHRHSLLQQILQSRHYTLEIWDRLEHNKLLRKT